MIKVSLIIPVYNAEKYLAETFDCVCAQSLQEIEVIIINDGSKDRSGEICDQFAEKDARFKVFHQENKGMCASRNFALSIATGEYIGFADNDDIFDKDFLKDNYELAKRYGADMVKFGRKGIYINERNEKIGEETRQYKKGILNHQQIVEDYYELQLKGVFSAVWDGLYRGELLRTNRLKFHEEFRYGCEDTLFNREMVPYLEKLVLNNKCYYYHLIRQHYSASAKFNDKALDKYRQACALEYKVWEELGINNLSDGKKEQGIAKEYLIPVLFMLCDSNCKYSFKEKKAYLNRVYDSCGFNMNLTKQKKQNLMKLNKKRAVMICLFDKKRFRVLLCVAAWYKKVINRKLAKGVIV